MTHHPRQPVTHSASAVLHATAAATAAAAADTAGKGRHRRPEHTPRHAQPRKGKPWGRIGFTVLVVAVTLLLLVAAA